MKLSTRIHFSINDIGTKRFHIGWCSGLIVAITLSFFYNYGFELLYLCSLSHECDLFTFSKAEIITYRYFFAAFSTISGLAISVSIWLSGGNRNNHKRIKIRKWGVVGNILPVFTLFLLVIVRFGNIIFVLTGSGSYDGELKLFQDHKIILIAIPLFLFLYLFTSMRLIYRNGKWIYPFCIIPLVLSLLFAVISHKDQNRYNSILSKYYATEHQYIENELILVKEKYNLSFDNETIEVLKKMNTGQSLDQMEAVYFTFYKNDKITLDTIIFQRLITHNFKIHNELMWQSVFLSYPEPLVIFNHITSGKYNSYELHELFLLLREEIELINTPIIREIGENSLLQYTKKDLTKSYYVHRWISPRQIHILSNIRDSLLKREDFATYHNLLPEINIQSEHID